MCSSKLKNFLELHPRKTVHFLEQIMPLTQDKSEHACVFVPVMEAIVYVGTISSNLSFVINFLTFWLPLCPLPRQSSDQTESQQIHEGHLQHLH